MSEDTIRIIFTILNIVLWYTAGRLHGMAKTAKRYNDAIFKAYRDQTWRDQNNV